MKPLIQVIFMVNVFLVMTVLKKCLFISQHWYARVIYELDAWPKIPVDHFKLKNFLYGATDIMKNSDKEK